MIPSDTSGTMDAYVISRLLDGLRPFTVRKWAQRGRLERRGTDVDGRTLYRFADVEQLWLESRRGT